MDSISNELKQQKFWLSMFQWNNGQIFAFSLSMSFAGFYLTPHLLTVHQVSYRRLNVNDEAICPKFSNVNNELSPHVTWMEQLVLYETKHHFKQEHSKLTIT